MGSSVLLSLGLESSETGARVSQSVKVQLDFDSGHDLTVHESVLGSVLKVQSLFGFLSLPLSLCLSLSK